MTWNNLKRIARTKKGWQLNYNISGRKSWPLKSSHFIVARHWNSDTPIIPRKSLENISNSDPNGAVGGGYFLRHNGIGIAIDPGHAFLKSLYERHDIAATDIDVIIITHFHQDHCGDIANYLTFSRIHDYRPVIFAPIPVLQYLNLLDTADLNPISPGMSLSIYFSSQETTSKIIEIKFLPALHWQTITPSSFIDSRYPTFIDFHMSAVGLNINLRRHREPEGESVKKVKIKRPKINRIVITGDTLFPLFNDNMTDFTDKCYELYLDDERDYIHLNNVNAITRPAFKDILRLYFLNYIMAYYKLEADLVCYHIGSIENQFADIQDSGLLNFQYNGYHLGVLGILRLMKLMKFETQKISIITEWGEELRGERKNIAKFIGYQASRIYNNKKKKLRKTLSIPSDVDLMIDLQNELLKCSDHFSFHYYSQMSAHEQDSEYIKFRSIIKTPELAGYEKTCNWE